MLDFVHTRDDLATIHSIAGSRGVVAGKLTLLGMLAASGLTSRQYVRVLPALIRHIFPVQMVGFYWSSPAGDMIDAFVEEPYLMSAKVVLSCMRFQQADSRNWPSFSENVLAGPVTGYLLPYQTEAFYASSHYEMTYGTIRAHHILDAVVHDGTEPKGCWLFMRTVEQGPWNERERDLASRLAQLMCLGFSSRAIPTPASRTFPAGVLMVDRDCTVQFSNLEAYQSLWMLSRNPSEPMHLDLDDDIQTLARRHCGSAVKKVLAAGQYLEAVSNDWGEFRISYQSNDADIVGITLTHLLPFECHLALALVALPLSPRRMMIAWLVATGLTRKEIAWRLGLGLDTINEHITAIFEIAGVSSTFEFNRKLAN